MGGRIAFPVPMRRIRRRRLMVERMQDVRGNSRVPVFIQRQGRRRVRQEEEADAVFHAAAGDGGLDLLGDLDELLSGMRRDGKGAEGR